MFVPISETDWARQRVRQEFGEYYEDHDSSPAEQFVLDLLAPPQSRTEAGVFVALSFHAETTC